MVITAKTLVATATQLQNYEKNKFSLQFISLFSLSLLFLFAYDGSFRFHFRIGFPCFAYMRTKRKKLLFFASKRKTFRFRFASFRFEAKMNGAP